MAAAWLKWTTVIIVGSVVLQYGCFVAPGWLVLKGPLETVYYSMTYILHCPNQGGCNTKTLPDHIAGLPHSLRGGVLYSFVSTMIKMLICLCVCTATMIMKLLALRTHIWTDTATLICLLALAITNTLQWDMVAQSINIAVNFSDTSILSGMTSQFPWCIALYGVASLLTGVVLVIHFVFFAREHIQPLIENYAALE